MIASLDWYITAHSLSVGIGGWHARGLFKLEMCVYNYTFN